MAKKKKEELLQIESTSASDNILLPDKVDMDKLRSELKDYVDDKVSKTFFDELEKTNKKLIREKSKRLFWKNIIIVILLLIIGFLVYLLYSNHYFDKYFNRENNVVEKDEKKDEVEPTPTITVNPTATPSPTPTPKIPTQDELKEEYGSLLDNYYVTDGSIYLVDYYDGKLTEEMQKYITLNNFDFSTFVKEEDYNIIKESLFQKKYEELFNDDYKSGSFSYDENKIRYVKAMESYMTSSLLVRDDNNIKREIKNIKLDGSEVIITTVEGVIKENKLYNVVSNNEVEEYNDNSLLKYEDKLNTLIYTFKDSKLVSLSNNK